MGWNQDECMGQFTHLSGGEEGEITQVANHVPDAVGRKPYDGDSQGRNCHQ